MSDADLNRRRMERQRLLRQAEQEQGKGKEPAHQDDALISEQTIETAKKAAAATSDLGRRLFNKAKVATQAATEKATAKASEVRADLEARKATRLVEKTKVKEPAPVWAEPEVRPTPVARPKRQEGSPHRMPLIVSGAVLLLVMAGLAAWWLTRDAPATEQTPAEVPVEETMPASIRIAVPITEPVEPEPVNEEPTPAPVVEAVATPTPVPAADPPPVASAVISRTAPPVESKPQPKPTGPAVKKPRPSPAPPKAPDWRDKAANDLDRALEDL